MSPLADRRVHPRYDIPACLRLEWEADDSVRTRAVNLSSGGAFFLAAAAPDVGEAVRLHLAIPRDTASTFFLEQFAAAGRVIRREPGPEGATAVAVAFDEPMALELP